MTLEQVCAGIQGADEEARQECLKRWSTIAKPLGSLGMLEENVVRIAVPVSLQQLITVGINLMDTIMLSSMGDAQLSASALAVSFMPESRIFCSNFSMSVTFSGCSLSSSSCKKLICRRMACSR